MDAQEIRKQRGLVIAATAKLEQKAGLWFVPSQSRGGHRYVVRQDDPNKPFCSCPDHEERQMKCKHIYAVEIVIQREFSFDGSKPAQQTVTETISITETVLKKPTYPQDWTNYNLAQTNEHEHFLRFLADLCRTVEEPEHKKGRKPIPLRDKVFSAVLKVYSMMSARRFSGDLKEAVELGYIEKTPHFNSVLNVFDDAEIMPILKRLVEVSATPLREVETVFAVDASGFSTNRFTKWFDEKYGVVRQKADWVKAHISVGVTTNVIVAVEVLEQHSGDSPQLPGLVETTAKTFRVKECTADKAYASLANYDAIETHGGTLYAAFKSDATGQLGGSFAKAFHSFCLNKDEWLDHYHMRSNVESTFSMVKRKFGDSVRSKTDTAMKNEVLAKFLCHNLCVLIAEMYTLGIQAVFTAKVTCTKTIVSAQKPALPAC